MIGDYIIMADYEVRLPHFQGRPELPTEVDEFWEITAWHVVKGEDIQQGQEFLTIETEDLEFTLSAPVTGQLKSLVAGVGQKVRAGDLLAIFDLDIVANE